MALVIKESIQLTLIGDGASVTATIDLAAAPLLRDFARRFPDRAVVTTSTGTLNSVLKNSTVTFTFPSAPTAGNGVAVSIALEYDI
jgi:hypothetical protein